MNGPTTTRRGALGGIAAALAIGSAPIVAKAAHGATLGSRAAWDAASAHLKTVDAEFARISGHYNSSYEAAEAACPYRGDFFNCYGLGCGDSRDRNFRAAQMRLTIERVAAKGSSLLPSDAKEVAAEANRIVDEFEEWRKQRACAYREHDQWEVHYSAISSELVEARDALLEAPAPDQAALLEKIELLALMMEEAEVEDAERISSIKSDARRLLSNGRA